MPLTSAPVTQIHYLSISPSLNLDGLIAKELDKTWAHVLDLVASSPGFTRLYWGRRLEEPEKVQLHVVRDTLPLHHDFLSSPLYRDEIEPLLRSLLLDGTSILIRHMDLSHLALGDPFSKALLGRPIGTAIYKACDVAWHQGAWPLWTHVVRRVDGCLGIAGGTVVGPVEGMIDSYGVYVGWASVKCHDDYHHTRHFRRHAVILTIGHRGFTEYGHIIFSGIQEKAVERL